MRQVMHGDLIAAARSLLELPPPERAGAAAKMLSDAHSADKVMKRTGAPHKIWGNGSLLAAALPKPKSAEPFLSDLDYLCALRVVVDALILRRRASIPPYQG